jgi:hypothetical protein
VLRARRLCRPRRVPEVAVAPFLQVTAAGLAPVKFIDFYLLASPALSSSTATFTLSEKQSKHAAPHKRKCYRQIVKKKYKENNNTRKIRTHHDYASITVRLSQRRAEAASARPHISFDDDDDFGFGNLPRFCHPMICPAVAVQLQWPRDMAPYHPCSRRRHQIQRINSSYGGSHMFISAELPTQARMLCVL